MFNCAKCRRQVVICRGCDPRAAALLGVLFGQRAARNKGQKNSGKNDA